MFDVSLMGAALIPAIGYLGRSVNMEKIYKPQQTPFGIVNGRDAIYLEEIKFLNRTNTLVLDVSFTSCLCSDLDDDVVDFNEVLIVFNNVLATKIIELDSWDWDSDSSFDEIIDSQWIKELGGKVTSKEKHYLVQTYDDVIEVVCENYEIKLNKTPNN